jgi:molybdenum-dependent DNA-binding transcriptional regulator ModE
LSANLNSVPGDETVLSALSDVSLEIMRERDKIERQIKELLEQNQDRKALQLMRKHLGVELRLKVSK